MRKTVQFAPKGVVLSFNAKESALVETLFVSLTEEELCVLKGMSEFQLTKLNYGAKPMILGNQSTYVVVSELKSRLHKEWKTAKVFSEYREHHFSRENSNHGFLKS